MSQEDRMSHMISTLPDSLDHVISSKVTEIIEKQWGKCITDIQHLYVGRFYERMTQNDGQVSYRPTNRYVLRVQFRYARELRRMTFNLI